MGEIGVEVDEVKFLMGDGQWEERTTVEVFPRSWQLPPEQRASGGC